MGQNLKTKGPFICQNPHCGKSFMGYSNAINRVCSKQCCKRKHPRRFSQCEVCKKEFEVRSSQHTGRFCSELCRSNNQVTKICALCGKAFTYSRSRAALQVHCSRACHFKARTRSIEERFWSKVNKTESCWLWIGAKGRTGQGHIFYNGKLRLAYRVAYGLRRGTIPDGLCVLHSCDNPACVNPDHLWLGTQADNVKDMHEKGRALKGYRGVRIRKRDWDTILRFYNYACALCGKTNIKLVKDHYQPLCKSGANKPFNIWPTCEDCNRRKGSKSMVDSLPPHAHLFDEVHIYA